MLRGNLPENSLCLLVVEEDIEIRVTDSNESCNLFPWNLPGLSQNEGQAAVNHASDWKRVHTLAERMYGDLRDVHRYMDRCCATGDDRDKTSANAIFRLCSDRIVNFSNGIGRLAPAVSEAECIQILVKLKSCIPAVKRSLSSPPNTPEFRDGTIFVGRVCTWLLEVLTRADQVLEQYFSELRAKQ